MKWPDKLEPFSHKTWCDVGIMNVNGHLLFNYSSQLFPCWLALINIVPVCRMFCAMYRIRPQWPLIPNGLANNIRSFWMYIKASGRFSAIRLALNRCHLKRPTHCTDHGNKLLRIVSRPCFWCTVSMAEYCDVIYGRKVAFLISQTENVMICNDR